jgi:hypothetical protein
MQLAFQGFGYSQTESRLFSVIVYACGFVGIILWAQIADRMNQRGFATAVQNAIAVVAYALVVVLDGTKARFAATCLLTFGTQANISLQLSGMAMNFFGYTRR